MTQIAIDDLVDTFYGMYVPMEELDEEYAENVTEEEHLLMQAEWYAQDKIGEPEMIKFFEARQRDGETLFDTAVYTYLSLHHPDTEKYKVHLN